MLFGASAAASGNTCKLPTGYACIAGTATSSTAGTCTTPACAFGYTVSGILIAACNVDGNAWSFGAGICTKGDYQKLSESYLYGFFLVVKNTWRSHG